VVDPKRSPGCSAAAPPSRGSGSCCASTESSGFATTAPTRGREGFDELWHLGQDDEEDVDLRYLAYARPQEPSAFARLLDRLEGRARDALRRRREARGSDEEGPLAEGDAEEPSAE
jgi:hypothetical protein